MTRFQWGALALGTALLAGTASAAAPPVDAQTINAIADQGFNHGEVVETIEYLSDQIGGRMTNSPAMRQAERYTQSRFTSWGLTNVRKQPFEFGRGWWIESSSVRMTAPRPIMLRAIPVAWSPPTDGPLSAPIVVAPLRSPRDFAAWRGKLKGKIVLTSQPTPPADETKLLPPSRGWTMRRSPNSTSIRRGAMIPRRPASAPSGWSSAASWTSSWPPKARSPTPPCPATTTA